MRYHKIVTAVVFAWIAFVSGGPLRGQWARTFDIGTNDYASSTLVAADGDIVVSGISQDDVDLYGTDSFLWIIKAGRAGRIAWKHVWESSSLSEGPNRNSAVVAPGGGFLLAASLKPRSDQWSLASAAFLVMLDSDGSIVWEKKYKDPGPGWALSNYKIRDACVLSAGGFIVVGSVVLDDANLWAARFDWEGNLLWQRQYSGGGREEGFAVKEESDGTLYIGGQTLSYGAGGYDFWVLNITDQGDVIWQKTFGGAANDFFRSLDVAPGGGCLLAGDTRSFHSDDIDVWILRIDRAGDILWQRAFGGEGEDWTGAIRADSKGGAFVVGSHFGRADDLFLLRLTAGGGIEWRKTFGDSIGLFDLSSDSGLAIDLVPGGCVIAGVTDLFGTSRDDLLLIEVSPAWEGSVCRFLKTVGTESIETFSLASTSYAGVYQAYAVQEEFFIPLNNLPLWSSRPYCPSKKKNPRR